MKMAAAEKIETDWEELFKELDEEYPTNYEPFVTYGSYGDLQDAADSNETSDLSRSLLW